ncbi:MAG: metalloregulator ArsR/SmtB family transcription factor [Bacillaceae bacterium]|nr:metalloregulator ArsR/SmtB family transcription factor [Bacillaceae bacterium]
MQLDRMVNFYKTLGDKTRIKLLILLSANGSMSGLQLAEKLAVTPPTVSHHISKLKESSLIRERRDKNTIYYFLNEKSLLQYNDALVTVLNRSKGEEEVVKKKENEDILQNFLLPDGRLKTIPAQRKKKLIIFEHILAELILGVKYSEKEINEHIKKFHDDYATIRREFIINHYMNRENGIYELNPQEMWAKIE